MPRNLVRCGDRKKETSSRWTKWAACTIATSGWRPEFVDFPTRASSSPSTQRRESLLLEDRPAMIPATLAPETHRRQKDCSKSPAPLPCCIGQSFCQRQPVTSSDPGGFVHTAKQGLDFRPTQVSHQPPRVPLIRDRQHTLDQSRVLRSFECGVVVKGTK